MKQTIFATVLLAGLAAAGNHGHAHKHMHLARDDDVVTVTKDVYVTETTVVWVPAGTDAPVASASAPSVPAAAPTSSQAAPPVQKQPVQPPVPQAPQPSSQAPAPAPVPAPSSSQAAPAPKPSQSSGGSAPSSGGTKAMMTYYNPDGHVGYCGTKLNDNDPVLAMAASDLKCGQKLKVTGPGGTFTATAMDTCLACASDHHLDLAQGFATQVAGSWGALEQAGKMPITWEWA